MRPDEQIRVSLHDKLVPLVGAEEAAYLMERNPPDPWADVAKLSDLADLATRADVDALGVALRTEMREEFGGLRAEMREGVGGLRAEMHDAVGGLRAEMHDAVGGLRAEMHDAVGGLRAEMRDLRGEVRSDIQRLREDMQAGFAAAPWRPELEALEHRLRLEIADTRVAVTDQLRDTYHKLVLVLVPSMLAGIGIVFSAARLA